MKFDHRFALREAAPCSRSYWADGVTMRLDFCSHMLRVALLRDDTPLLPTWSVWPLPEDCPLEGRDKLSTEGLETICPELEEDEKELRFSLDSVAFTVEKRNFRISARTREGLLYADRSGLAYNIAGELGDGSVHYTARFPGQEIFGLGDKCGPVNKSGQHFTLSATDSMGFRAENSDPLYKQIPFYICRNAAGSYGLFYDSLSNGSLDFGREHNNYYEPFNSIHLEEENLIFYLILGTPKEILQRFTVLTGGAAPVPDWAFRYCGSTMEYTDAPNSDELLRSFTEKCKEEGIHAGGFYMSSGYTQIGEQRCVFHWSSQKIPSPEGLASFFHSREMELIPNVKPAFLTTHPLYGHIAGQGWFLRCADGSPACFPFWGGMASYLDFTNPGAYAFWKDCVKRQLVERGYRHIWNDNNEYDVPDAEVIAHGFGQSLQARRIRPLFSYLMSRASREACLEVMGRDFVPFNVSRCAMAGTQRVASTWTGDNLTDFRDLRYNHFQAMTVALPSFAFFGADIGGFAGPQPERELFLRWLQYGVFTPRFVLHSWKPSCESTMPWLYPDCMDAVRRIFSLRERLLPYLRQEYERKRGEHLPLIYPVFLEDPDYDPESDCFFCGDRILACPVFDPGCRSVSVTLPACEGGWRLRGEGPFFPGKQLVRVVSLPEEEPVWFLRS